MAKPLRVPVLLPTANPMNDRPYSLTEQTSLQLQGVESLQMINEPGSITFADGSPAPAGTVCALNQVQRDKVPMPMPDGANPPFAWTLQPAGAHFNPPVKVI